MTNLKRHKRSGAFFATFVLFTALLAVPFNVAAAQTGPIEVTVKIVIDEAGNVISAKALNGPKEYRKKSEEAAMRAKFKPSILDGKAVRVTGNIIYKYAK
jgi:outer membrane biosynthesis protein TonB